MDAKIEQAEAYIDAALDCLGDDLDRAHDSALRAAELAHGHPALQLRVANLLFSLDDFDSAAAVLYGPARMLGNGCALAAEFAHLLGRIAAQRGEPAAVVEALLAGAFELAPDELEHGQHYGRLLTDRGRFRDAMGVVSFALEIHPADPYLLNLARFLDAHLARSRRGGSPPRSIDHRRRHGGRTTYGGSCCRRRR